MEFTRHQVREMAFQTMFSMLYQEEMTVDASIENILSMQEVQGEEFPEIPQYLELIVTGVKEHKDEIDLVIEKHLKSWKLNRLAKADLVILRLSVFEMLYVTDVPNRVSLNEALELTKRFSDDDSRRFVNGVLSSVMAELDLGE